MHFGDWLKHYRAMQYLTQQEMAEALGYAGITYQRVERGGTPSANFIDRLIVYLQLPSDEYASFHHFALTHEHSDPNALLVRLIQPTIPPKRSVPNEHNPGSLDSPPSSFPIPRTSLLGRRAEVEKICQMLILSDIRMITLTGPGGVGKTRLSLEIASQLEKAFRDGVRFVDLTPTTNPSMVLNTIAQALGIQEHGSINLSDQVQTYVRYKHMLLVLDNIEHVSTATPDVVRLLDNAAHLYLLLTSRVRLHLAGEHTVPVTPLALPPLDPLPPLDTLANIPAVALLMSRAQTIQPDVTLTTANASTIAAICHQVAGIPLALELAAARLRILTPHTLLQRLMSHCEALEEGTQDGPARHQSMCTTIDWSYQLLSSAEQQLLVRLAIFRGGWTLEAAEQICDNIANSLESAVDSHLESPGQSVVDTLATLLDSSLITRTTDVNGTSRFGMLVPIQNYAQEKLHTHPEASALAAHHAAYYLTLSEQAAAEFVGPQQRIWLDRIERDYDNLRVALAWTIHHAHTTMAFRFGSALYPFWLIQGYVREACHWLEQILTLGEHPTSVAQANVFRGYGTFLFLQNALEEAEEWMKRSLTMYHHLNDQEGVAGVLNNMGNTAYYRGNYAEATHYLTESLTLSRTNHDRPGIIRALNNLGQIAQAQQDFSQARNQYHASLTLCQEEGDINNAIIALTHLGCIAWQEQDLLKARQFLTDALQLARQINSRSAIADCLIELSKVALSQHDVATAHCHLSESVPLIYDSGDQLLVIDYLETIANLYGQEQHPLRAARFWGAAAARRTAMQIVRPPSAIVWYEDRVAAARSQVDTITWEIAWSAGMKLSWEEALSETQELGLG